MKRALQAIVLPRPPSARAMKIPRPHRAHSSSRSVVFAVFCPILAAVAVAGSGGPAQAECFARPAGAAPAGARWGLYRDLTSGHRCWVLVDATGHEISMVQTPPPSPPPPPSPLQTFLGNFTGLPPQQPQPLQYQQSQQQLPYQPAPQYQQPQYQQPQYQQPQYQQPQYQQPPQQQPLQYQDTAPAVPPAGPAPAVAAPPRRLQPRVARVNRPDHPLRAEQKTDGLSTVHEDEVVPPAPARHEMTESDSAALFQEFLRWQEMQKIIPAR